MSSQEAHSVLVNPVSEGREGTGFGTFELNLESLLLECGPEVAVLLGIDPQMTNSDVEHWERTIFVDDVPKVRSAIEAAKQTGHYYVEFRVRHGDGTIRWIAGKGHTAKSHKPSQILRGAYYEISDRKRLEARLLSLNETLESRVAELREETRLLEVLNRTGNAVAAELDLERLVQTVTDAGVELSGAQFGAFFHNVTKGDDESYMLYTLSGAPRSAFERFPMPRNTKVFDPTFRGQGPVRSSDILADPRYGQSPPYNGMPKGHLPVRSYLAVPVVSRSGEVLGGLFFGHEQTGVFTERSERLLTGLAGQAAVAIDNARLFQTSAREVAARKEAERNLQDLNQNLEQRIDERARQLAASTRQLEESERRFRLLIEGVTDYAIFMLDPGGHVVNWNPGAQKIKGYAPHEILGQHFSRFYAEPDRQKAVPQKALETATRTGKFEAEGWRVRKDGSTFWAHVVINAIRSADGELVGFAKVTRDLTERKQAEDRIRQSQKMEGIGQLTGGVAHDFNNLLTIIIGNLETLQRNISGDATADVAALRRSAENAMRGARRAESVTQRLLAFSRQQPLEPKSVDVGRLVSGMSDMFRRTLGEQISVETVLTGGLWRVHVDPSQLEVALINLAVNARDAMPNGGKLTIETANVHLDETYAAQQAEVPPGQYIVLAVSDNGAGMSADVKSKAFDPFFTTKDIGQGTGLGLSQVYGFVKQSRGNVKIYSEIGEGTTVKIYLPRFHSEAPVLEDRPSPIARARAGETILVVEDDEDVRNYSSETLRELGYKVLEASSGRSAMRVLETHPEIDVLFTDIGLPGGMNGRQLAEEARKSKTNLKVLFTTGYARNAIVHEGRLDPGVELLTKPFTQMVLAEKLRNIIDSRSTPARILVVEDETLIQMLAVDYLEEAGFRVDVAGSANEALNKLRLIPGGVDAAIVDIGLPDQRGDVLVRELRSIYPSLPIVLASGHDQAGFLATFPTNPGITSIKKPYSSEQLCAALRHVGIRH